MNRWASRNPEAMAEIAAGLPTEVLAGLRSKMPEPGLLPIPDGRVPTRIQDEIAERLSEVYAKVEVEVLPASGTIVLVTCTNDRGLPLKRLRVHADGRTEGALDA